MAVTGGAFVANDEVDLLMSLPPREAQVHVLAGRDRPVLRIRRRPPCTRPWSLYRRGERGEWDAWQGEDRTAPWTSWGTSRLSS